MTTQSSFLAAAGYGIWGSAATARRILGYREFQTLKKQWALLKQMYADDTRMPPARKENEVAVSNWLKARHVFPGETKMVARLIIEKLGGLRAKVDGGSQPGQLVDAVVDDDLVILLGSLACAVQADFTVLDVLLGSLKVHKGGKGDSGHILRNLARDIDEYRSEIIWGDRGE